MTAASRSIFQGALTFVAAAASLAFLTACPNGDVGAPCNHGTVTPPNNILVTFPALSCNDLLCVYGEEEEAPDRACNSDSDCNADSAVSNTAVPRFECNQSDSSQPGSCRLSLQYVLLRSMCSKRCSSDDDCKNSGIGTANNPVSDKTECDSGFSCRRIQQLGEFCCDQLCVCNDLLPEGVIEDLDRDCGEPDANGEYAFCNNSSAPTTDGDTTTGG